MRIDVDGQQVFYATGAAAQPDVMPRPTVVFLHGAGMDHTVWTMPARYFARHGWRVIAPDLPGHGRTSGPPLETIEAMADWLAALLQAVEVESATVVGHSMGSLVTASFAARYPERTERVVLLGASLPMPVTEVLLGAARDNHEAAYAMANTWSHSARGKLGGNANPGVWMMGAGETLLKRSADDVFHADLAACNAFAAPLVRPEDVVATVIVGEADQMTPRAAGIAVAEALQAHVVGLPGCGHSMLSEAPNQVLDALIEALAA